MLVALRQLPSSCSRWDREMYLFLMALRRCVLVVAEEMQTISMMIEMR